MSRDKDKILSVAEVLELEPGTDENPAWVNDGFRAFVYAIKSTKTQQGRTMNICTLRDTVIDAEISCTFFGPVKFREGDTIEMVGALRRTEYRQLAQVTPGKATAIHVVAGSREPAPRAQERPGDQPPTRVPDGDRLPGLSEEPSHADRTPVYGSTVGMAIKEAISLIWHAQAPTADINTPAFWKQVHTTASDIIRVSNALEKGNLAPACSARQGGTTPAKAPDAQAELIPPATAPAPAKAAPPATQGRADPPRGTNRKPPAGPDGSVKLPDNDEDVPF